MGLRFDLLGPVRIRQGDRLLALGSAKQRMLLTALLLEPNRTVSLDVLTSALWDEAPPKSAVSNLRTYANQLRRVLADSAPRLIARRPGYALAVEPGELDSARFLHLLRLGRADLAAGAPRRAALGLEAALALWRGHAAEDLPRTLALAPRLQALEDQRGSAVDAYAAARLALGENDAVAAELHEHLAAHPTRERLWAHLMLALYRCGDAAGALAAYARARDVLVNQLGVDPGPELVALQQAVLKRDPKLDRVPEPRLKVPSRWRTRGIHRGLRPLYWQTRHA
ncbi:AfsR/SARP family transcriptional regulator [Actinomadura nitritigenes]|uniref:AfsR/SARP family transcriptional regulator n=1 Tax=Actinomadura nitritigenes TaxID=134602 RepID=UPI003D8E4249